MCKDSISKILYRASKQGSITAITALTVSMLSGQRQHKDDGRTTQWADGESYWKSKWSKQSVGEAYWKSKWSKQRVGEAYCMYHQVSRETIGVSY